MRSAIIDRRLMYLEQLFVDMKEIQDDINITADPSLILEYEEEWEVLFKDMEQKAQDMFLLLEAYFEDCKTENIPVVLEYHKIYKEILNARRLKILSME